MPVIAVLAGEGSLGGTQKAAALLAGGLVARGYNVHFLCYRREGLWIDYVVSHGASLHVLPPGAGSLRDILVRLRPDILHQHVPGGPFIENPVYAALKAMAPGTCPAVIETNVFGILGDREGDRWGVRRMFVSRSSCIQAFRRCGRSIAQETLREVAVLPNPVTVALPVDAATRAARRAELGVEPTDVLAIRLGRPDARKWTDWECRAFAKARRRMPALRLLLMEPPDPLRVAIERGDYGEGIIVLPVTSDLGKLGEYYAASDLMVHASRFGESFGYTIGEAMAAALPVITMTTPYGDNAQVELVENGASGWVCGSVGELARRWCELGGHADQRHAMGAVGKCRIADLAGMERGLDILEAVIQEALTGEESAFLAARRHEWLDFASEFAAREYRLSESARVGVMRLALYAAYRNVRHRLRLAGQHSLQRWRQSQPGADRILVPAVVSVNEPLRYLVVADGGVGGMQKAAARYAVAMAGRGMAVDFVAFGDGPWVEFCAARGIRVTLSDGRPDRLVRSLETARPHVVHQHVSGYDAGGYQYAAYRLARRRQAFRIIESNVFGQLNDAESLYWVDFRFFKSMTSLIGANRVARLALTATSLHRQGVLYNPVEIPDALSEDERQAFRSELGVGPSHVLVVRTGRPDPRKWVSWGCRAFQYARREIPELRLVMIEPPERLKAELAAGRYGPSITALPLTSDFAWLRKLYLSADLMMQASYFGESFGYSIAEAMAAGLPVITRTTPFGDNAQVELVETGETGWICAGAREMGRRIAELSRDGHRRKVMGHCGRQRIQSLAGSENGIQCLDSAMHQVVMGQRASVLDRQAEEILRYSLDFDARQWRTSEPWRTHPVDYAGARLYSIYRHGRRALRRMLDVGLPGARNSE